MSNPLCFLMCFLAADGSIPQVARQCSTDEHGHTPARAVATRRHILAGVSAFAAALGCVFLIYTARSLSSREDFQYAQKDLYNAQNSLLQVTYAPSNTLGCSCCGSTFCLCACGAPQVVSVVSSGSDIANAKEQEPNWTGVIERMSRELSEDTGRYHSPSPLFPPVLGCNSCGIDFWSPKMVRTGLSGIVEWIYRELGISHAAQDVCVRMLPVRCVRARFRVRAFVHSCHLSLPLSLSLPVFVHTIALACKLLAPLCSCSSNPDASSPPSSRGSGRPSGRT